jgi:hypothetical protein
VNYENREETAVTSHVSPESLRSGCKLNPLHMSGEFTAFKRASGPIVSVCNCLKRENMRQIRVSVQVFHSKDTVEMRSQEKEAAPEAACEQLALMDLQ